MIVWDGLEELKADLRALPETLAGEAQAIVRRTADAAAAGISTDYPTGPTGNLKARVTVTQSGSRFGAIAIVKSGAPHASIFEFGTTIRQTKKGANRGQMPKAPDGQAMIPYVIRARRRMYDELAVLVRGHGFEVPDA